MKIDVCNVSKTFTRCAGEENIVLDDISFAASSGDFVVILGESGGGKTTLLNLLSGLEPPTSGDIFVDDIKVNGLHPSRSMLFQQPVLLPWLTVKDNVAYGCQIRGDIENLDYRVYQFIEMIGLSGFENAKPASLSLGMAQRVCLARALVGHPEMILLDEPFASLDTFTQEHIQEELVNIWLSERFTAVFVTHDINEAILLGNKIILIGGYPGYVIGVYDIDDPYPRNINDSSFKSYRKKILTNLKQSHVGSKKFFQCVLNE